MQHSRHTARHKKFQAALKAARKAKGLTQAQVGERLGRPQSYVNKYETGERRLDVIEFLDVATALGTNVGKMLRLLSVGSRSGEKSNHH